jgi:hypothetical protein
LPGAFFKIKIPLLSVVAETVPAFTNAPAKGTPATSSTFPLMVRLMLVPQELVLGSEAFSLLSFLQDNCPKNTIHIQDVMSQWAGNLFFIFFYNSEVSVCNCSHKNKIQAEKL